MMYGTPNLVLIFLPQTFREFQRLSDGLGFRIKYIDKTSDLTKIKKETERCGKHNNACLRLAIKTEILDHSGNSSGWYVTEG